MAFTQEPTATPSAIEDISIQLSDILGGSKAATYSVQVRMSDGTLRVRTGNLLPHITSGQTSALSNFMDSLRTQAQTEILP